MPHFQVFDFIDKYHIIYSYIEKYDEICTISVENLNSSRTMCMKGSKNLHVMQIRNSTIDNAKGIGILAVVLSHNWYSLGVQGELYRILFSFHMPLFFMLSGVFFKPQVSFGRLCLSKTDALLKPVLVVCVLMLIFMTRKASSQPLNITEYIFANLYGTNLSMVFGPMWFLTHLFLIFLFSWIIVRLLFDYIKALWMKLLVSFVMLAFGTAHISAFWSFYIYLDFMKDFSDLSKFRGLPFNADLILVSTPYFLMGYLLADYLKGFRLNKTLFFFSLIIFTGLHLIFNQTIVFASREYGDLIIATLQALLGIYIILSIAYVASKDSLASRCLSYLGVSSLFILIFHYAIELRVTYSLMYHFPNYQWANALAGYVSSIVVALLLWELTQRIKLLRLLMLPIKK